MSHKIGAHYPRWSKNIWYGGFSKDWYICSWRSEIWAWGSAQLSSYREEKSGQVLEEGINEAGAMSSWIAAGTSYTNHDIEMIPIYLFYSMFGFQRIGDLLGLEQIVNQEVF